MNLRDHDREHYLLTLFAPRRVRTDMGVVFAFAFELAAIRMRVRERQIGAIRLAWWRDFLTRLDPDDESAKAPSANPAPKPAHKSALAAHRGSRHWALHDQLAMVCRHYHLPVAKLLAMVEMQLVAWEDDYFATSENIWNYAATHEGTTLQLAAAMLGKSHLGQNSLDTAHKLGQIYGVVRMMSAFPERLPRLKLAELPPDAQAQLDKIRPLCAALPKTLMPIRLVGLLATRRLRHIRAAGGDAATLKDLPADPFLPLFMEFAAWRRRDGW
ncbi:MAG: squalene/phytoene synthase family protein [Candidatus Symbiobacter sp.]|nr:squalene/phytoene synthase family protein [Candidatus Symbiobacter sp.]